MVTKEKIKPIRLSCELDDQAGKQVLAIKKKYSLGQDTRNAIFSAIIKYFKKQTS